MGISLVGKRRRGGGFARRGEGEEGACSDTSSPPAFLPPRPFQKEGGADKETSFKLGSFG